MWTILKRDFGWKFTYGKCAMTKLPIDMHWPPHYGPRKNKIYHQAMSINRIVYLSRNIIEDMILRRLGLTSKEDLAYAMEYIRDHAITVDNIPSTISRRIQPDPNDDEVDRLIENYIKKEITDDDWAAY